MVFFWDPPHGTAADGAVVVASGDRILTGLKSSVVSDAGFFRMDLISAITGVVLAVSECDRLAGPVDDPIPRTAGGLHRRRGGLTGDWSCGAAVIVTVVVAVAVEVTVAVAVAVAVVSVADPSSYHTDDDDDDNDDGELL